MANLKLKPFVRIFPLLAATFIGLSTCGNSEQVQSSFVITPSNAYTQGYIVSGSLTKKLILDVTNSASYATVSVYANGQLLVDSLNVPKQGQQVLNALVQFEQAGAVELKIKSLAADLTINQFKLVDVNDLVVPKYQDISVQAGLDKADSIKYGGPSIADIDNDGDYDFIANNHNAETSKLYWNNGDGTFKKHHKDLSRWFMQDLHGTALADYDLDGDLDLILTQGGGNGKNPSRSNFYLNDNNELIRYTGDIGIDRGGRGRGARWGDFDLDGDLDFLIVNETGLANETPQHFFYENNGQGKFKFKSVEGIQDQRPERALVTDLNGDHIEDIILFGHSEPVGFSAWLGNGDFTFTRINDQFPQAVADALHINAITDIDIDNDGDLDLYIARGYEFEHGEGETPSVDFDPDSQVLSVKPRGYAGVDEWEFTSEGQLKLDYYYYLGQKGYRGKAYPIFLGKGKTKTPVPSGETFEFTAEQANGWPDDFTENGVYFGYLGDGRWKAALVREDDIFWSYRFNLTGVTGFTPKFIPQNRNLQDYLLRNDNGKFVDVSEQWNIAPGGNSMGVTHGDFNNDGMQDLFVYRWGNVGHRISDLMLVNTGQSRFETLTMHGANDVGGPGYGDMGQAFDFDLDGDLDLLSGSEFGQWYLYDNQTSQAGNYALVRVGYAPNSNIDAFSAEVTVKTASQTYTKRVGSAGEIFSQSLLNIVHFGLGQADKIEKITVRWRNGETVEFNEKSVNALFDTNKLDPVKLSIEAESFKIRQGASSQLSLTFSPNYADKTVSWSSSDERVLKVSDSGVVEAIGELGKNATITATSAANGLSASAEFEIVKWYAKPIQSVALTASQSEIIAGKNVSISALIMPLQPDNADLQWTSSNTEIAIVSESGLVEAKQAGEVVISALAKADNKVKASLTFKVQPYIKPYIEIVEANKFANQPIKVAQEVEVTVKYHAGAGHKVVSADEGGIRLWLRHFNHDGIPVKDIVLAEPSAINTLSGIVKFKLPLNGIAPTQDLMEGHFYSLRATFTSSNGDMYDEEIYPVNFVK
ncbi:FG-GAP-like repeat-containing protein [Catenovulum sp. 2E275]|uniref:FG-GAP-like repeat-containing protein n=1 Tax=Catenovulum sp. 2E275 TaxID=2980497 RepID=UPI0021CE2269|nr:FG-GAP-like repeat-containing protein [Catenovulum sp. 2E275]MCU4675597.1 FG-GAP-like repeat-containing protein [Catenovulum sp. 2E275]